MNNTKEKAIDAFLEEKPKPEAENPDMDCTSGVCIIKNDKSIHERINKKIITEDGRQLLI